MVSATIDSLSRQTKRPVSLPLNSQLIASFKGFSRIASFLVTLIACLVLAGWVFHNPFLKSVIPGLTPMNPMTAIAFIFGSTAVWLSNASQSYEGYRRLVQTCAGAVIIIACARLAAYCFHIDPQLDQLLFHGQLEMEAIPNRMAPNTALGFLFTGIALMLFKQEDSWTHRPSQYVALAALILSLFTLTGYAYQVIGLMQVGAFIPMALHTALSFLLLSLGILCLSPDSGLMAVITSSAAGGQTARRLLPAAIIIPFFLGWLRLQGQQVGLWGTESGIAFMVLSGGFIFGALIWWHAKTLNGIELMRREMEIALRQARDELEVRIQERTAELAQANQALQADIVERKRAEEELRAAYDTLRETQAQLVQSEKLSAIGQLSASIAHELKNPLAVILQGITYVQGGGWKMDASTGEALTMMKDAVTRADGIVRGLLDFARPEELKLAPCQMNAVLESSLASVRRQFSLDRITVVKRLTADPIEVLIDEGQMQQVFINLIANAIQAMPQGGQLLLQTLLQEAHMGQPGVGRRATDRFRPGDPVLVCEVRDTGTGISADKLAKIFEPFFTTKPKGQGTGLGLAIVRSLVDAHRGQITVTSQEGQGTTFTIVLPVGGRSAPRSSS